MNTPTSQNLGQGHARSLCVETTLPEWIELLPVGNIVGRDGRAWHLTDAQKVLDAFALNKQALPIDFEHATEIKAVKGEKAPAVGWIEELAIVDGLIKGRVVWTAEGAEAILNREYRYVSPVFVCTKGGEVIRLTSVGLTNQPNLHLKALNTQQKGDSMKAICKRLGLADDASEIEILKALELLQTERASNAEAQTLKNVVPRTEFDAVQTRALNAEKALKDQADAELEKAINSSVDDAITAKKITPASKGYFTTMCRKEGGLDEFKAFINASPVMLAPSSLDGKDAPNTGTGLSDLEKATCRAMNLSEEAFKASKETK